MKEDSPAEISQHDHLLREVKYWQAAFDRISADVVTLKKSHDDWKLGYENIAAQIQQWEKWDNDKKREIERLNTALVRLNQSVDVWKADNKKLIMQIQQWESWYKSLQEDRDKYKQWDHDKKAEIDHLNRSLEVWKADQAKLVDTVKQWEAWFKSMEADRDKYKKWDQDKRVAMDRQQLEIKQLGRRIELLLDNPLHYIRSFFRWKFKKQM